MNALTAEAHAELLKRAELHFRLMVAVRTGSALGNLPLKVPIWFSFGKHAVVSTDIALTRDDADEGAAIMEHVATNTLVLAIVQAMKDVFPNPRYHADENVRSAFEIARLIRNAYAHQPFRPCWLIDKFCKNKILEVTNIVRLQTAELFGKPVTWQHYGGMLAILRLSQYVRSVIYPSEVIPMVQVFDSENGSCMPPCNPGDVIQHGQLLFICQEKTPDGSKSSRFQGTIELAGPDGTYTFRPAQSPIESKSVESASRLSQHRRQ